MGAACSNDVLGGNAKSRARDTAKAKARRATVTGATAFDALPSKGRKVSVAPVGPLGTSAQGKKAQRQALASTRAEELLDQVSPFPAPAVTNNTSEIRTDVVNPLSPSARDGNHGGPLPDANMPSDSTSSTCERSSTTTPAPLAPRFSVTGQKLSSGSGKPQSTAPDAPSEDAKKRRLSIIAPSESDFQQASGYTSLTSPLANLIRVHDCFSSSQNPSKGSEASSAVKSLTAEMHHTTSSQQQQQPMSVHEHQQQELSLRSASTRSESSIKHSPKVRHIVPDTRRAQQQQQQETSSEAVTTVAVSNGASGFSLSPVSHAPSPVRRVEVGNEEAGGATSTNTPTAARTQVSSSPNRSARPTIQQQQRRSVVASLSPSAAFMPAKRVNSASDTTIIEMLKNIEHLSKFDLKGLVQNCRRNGVFRVFERSPSNPRYNQFVVDTLSSLCLARMLILRSALQVGLTASMAATENTSPAVPEVGYDSSRLMPSDRRVIAEMVSTNVIHHAISNLSEILSDNAYMVGRYWTDEQAAKIDAVVNAAEQINRGLPLLNAAWEEYKSSSVRRIAAAAIGGSSMSERHVPDEVIPGFFVSSYHTALDAALMESHHIEAVVSCVGDLFLRPKHTDDRGDDEDRRPSQSSSTFFASQQSRHSRRQSPRRASILSDGASTCSSVTSTTALARVAGGEVDTLDDDDTADSDEVTFTFRDGVAFCNFELRDRATFRIDKSFAAATAFVRQQYLAQGKRVLFVCGVGASRAPTVAAACMCDMFGLAPHIALRLIKSVRPQVKPNDAFLLHLLRCYSPQSLPQP